MGTGWRRAFCTTIPRDGDEAIISDKQLSPSPSPCPSPRMGLFSRSKTSSSPSHILRCRTSDVSAATKQSTNEIVTPKVQCETTTGNKSAKSAIPMFLGSNPLSPRSPLKLSLFRNSFRLRNICGVCTQSVKTGQGMAIYTAECGHAFHFPCIAAHVRKQFTLICPVCCATWQDVPLLFAAVNEPIKSSTPKKDVNHRQSSPKLYHHQIVQTRLPEVKSYGDDEPLLSPKIGKFVPIPETEENDDDVDEFQGFFVNPIASCSMKSSDIYDCKNVNVKLMPETAVISVNRSHETYVIAMTVKAPPSPPLTAHNSDSAPLLDQSRRAPIDLVTVLDVSQSMTGAKLQMMKRAMRLVISSLGSADRLSVVAFSACPKRVLALTRMTAQGQRSARSIIDRLVIGQVTSNVGDALRKSTKVLEDRRERNPVASIILLSDGHDNPVQDNANNQRQTIDHVVNNTRFAHVEIPVQSFGYEKSEPAEDAFAKCVGGLLSVVVQDLQIQLGFVPGSAPAEIAAVYCCNGRPTVLSSGTIRLGDLYAEEERELLVEFKVPTSFIGAHHEMSAKCCYNDPSTREILYNRERNIIIPAPYGSRSTSSRIERLRYLFIATQAIAESRRLVERDNFASAHHMLSSARALLIKTNSVSADEYIRGLETDLVELAMRRQQQHLMMKQQQQMTQQRSKMGEMDENCEPLTPRSASAWRAAEQLAKVAQMKKSTNRVRDLHGFENARF